MNNRKSALSEVDKAIVVNVWVPVQKHLSKYGKMTHISSPSWGPAKKTYLFQMIPKGYTRDEAYFYFGIRFTLDPMKPITITPGFDDVQSGHQIKVGPYRQPLDKITPALGKKIARDLEQELVKRLAVKKKEKDMSNLRSKVAKLASENPELRSHLVPILKEAVEDISFISKYPEYIKDSIWPFLMKTLEASPFISKVSVMRPTPVGFVFNLELINTAIIRVDVEKYLKRDKMVFVVTPMNLRTTEKVAITGMAFSLSQDKGKWIGAVIGSKTTDVVKKWAG